MDDIKALLFDTGGTILDWHTGIRSKLEEIGKRRRIDVDWAAITNTYRRRSLARMTAGGPDFQPDFNIDDVHREQIERVMQEHALGQFTSGDFDEVQQAWHRLACWPDVPAGLARLRSRFIVASLTILSFRLIIDTCRRADITWDAVFSCEAIGFYKTRPQAYLRAAQWLQLDPSACMMVAAHPVDLAAAASVGYRTAFVRRPLEWGGDETHATDQGPFTPDYTVNSFEELADAFDKLH
jgi:2-haloacid dehalogenase